jgi:short subunit dehydrogenase-like uncharacterized protein
MSVLKKVAVITTVITTTTVAVTAVGRYTKFGRYIKDCGKFGWNYVMLFGEFPSASFIETNVEAIYEKHYG